MEPENKEQETTNFSEHCFLTLLNIRTGYLRVSMVTKRTVHESIERIYRTGLTDLHWIVEIDEGKSGEERHYGTINEPTFMVMVKGVLEHSPLPKEECLTGVVDKFGLVSSLSWEKFY